MSRPRPSGRSYGRLTRRERNAIERMLDRNRSAREIAVELGRLLSTVTRGAWGGDTPPPGTPRLGAASESWFWHANDMVVAGDMNLVVRVLWVALIVGIGVATMATLWIVTR